MAKEMELTQQAMDSRAHLTVREGEPARLWYRCDRIFCVDNAWYFHTREGLDVGPYRCQFDAELEVGMLLQKLRQTPEAQIHQVIRNHMLETQGGAGALNTAAFTDYLIEVGGVELLRQATR
ncbi:MAG: DUF6316 family protein [Pseudomonadales bacterium]|jgi:hypothetical protein|nr:DUF6316 family protein [Pseudomonadales bacterium]